MQRRILVAVMHSVAGQNRTGPAGRLMRQVLMQKTFVDEIVVQVLSLVSCIVANSSFDLYPGTQQRSSEIAQTRYQQVE